MSPPVADRGSMKQFAPVLAGLCLVASLATPTLASPCSEQIQALSGKVKAETHDAIAANTSGQGTAAKRGGEGVTGTEGARANEAPQAPPEKSAEAGKGADAAQQAKVALEEAKTADAKGDAKGCEAAVERAKSQLGKAP
ncbi:hypothetical protein FMGBMHLM_0399 [Methylobacterium aerolatum]|nr:hypothetical protein FMGBMHLM_0399 [Methylobacterium aerolatum]